MKRVKIFLASSIEDLREDRLQVGDFIRQLNEIYLDSGVHFSLIKCEDYDNSIVSGGKQQKYDREIRQSELVFFLFFRKVGDYTRHEFEVALEAFQQQKKPRIITYFKNVSAPEEAAEEVRAFMQLLDGELKHYYNTYGHIDTLKLGMLMQIKLLQLDASQLKLENGQVLLGGKAVVQAENVPMLRGNQTLRELTEKRRQLQQQLDQCRSAYLTDPTPEKEAAFFGASAELNRVSKELTQVEQETMALLTSVVEMTADGRVLTRRLKEALKQFDRGDYAAVRTILADEERENELRRAEDRAAAAKNEIQGYVEEELLLIRTEKSQILNQQRAKRIQASYEKVVALVEKYDLDKWPLYEYAAFLQSQNDQPAAIAVAEKLQGHWSKPGVTIAEDEQAMLLNLLGVVYSQAHRYGQAEEAYGKAVEIYARLAAQDPGGFELRLATIYSNLGLLWRDTKQYGKAEESYHKALKIRTDMATQDLEGWATIYINIGALYGDTKQYRKAEEAYEKALEIYTGLAARDPEGIESKLATLYNNLGIMYAATKRYGQAEEAYNKAIDAHSCLVTQNPEAFEPNLAGSCNNLGSLFKNTQRYGEAEEAYGKAVEIYTRLAARNPEAFEPDLAGSYNSLGKLYQNTQRYGEAEEMYCKAMEIRTRLAARNPEAFEPDLAANCYVLGLLRHYLEKYAEAAAVYSKSVELYTSLAARDSETYLPKLAESYGKLGGVYIALQQYGQVENAYNKTVEIYTRLAEQNPDAYETSLADALWNLVSHYVFHKNEKRLKEVLLLAQPLYKKLAQNYPEQYYENAEALDIMLS